MSKSRLERDFAFQLYAVGIRDFEREWVFAPPRRFRFDFAFVFETVNGVRQNRKQPIAVEIEGAIWKRNSGHRTYAGVKRDILKSQIALTCKPPWLVLRLTSEEVKSGKGVELLERLLKDE